MFSPRCILVPTDFSVSSEQAVAQAAVIADGHDCVVHLAHVIVDETSILPFVIPESKVEHIISKSKEIALQELGILSEKYLAKLNISAEIHVREGHPHDEILSIADKIHAELILISHTKRTALEGFMHKSLTNRIIQNAKCCVCIVK